MDYEREPPTPPVLTVVNGIYGPHEVNRSLVAMIGPPQMAIQRDENEKEVGRVRVRQLWLSTTNSSITVLDTPENWIALGQPQAALANTQETVAQ